jgi:hypothetical protein
VYGPHQIKGFDIALFFILLLIGFCGALGKDEREAYFHHIILISQKLDLRRC